MTGLEAITFVGPDQFIDNVLAPNSNPNDHDYQWSNPANWSRGLPVNGDNVVLSGVYGTDDDIPSLSLASLNLNGKFAVFSGVGVRGTLTVGTLYTLGDGLIADSSATITIGAIVNPGHNNGNLAAVGPGARLIDDAATDSGGTVFYTQQGGMVEIVNASPANSSTLEYVSPGTIALFNPAATSSVGLKYVLPNDVLELPGTSVSSVTRGASSLSVTTDAGTYAFTNVTYGPFPGDDDTGPIIGTSAAVDPNTGLVAITFMGPDVFEENVKATAAPFNGAYLWSNAANWSRGLPVSGDSVVFADPSAYSVDDLAVVTLNTLNQGAGGHVYVQGGSLSIGTLTGATGSELFPDSADDGITVPSSVTVGTIAGAGAIYAAKGTGSRFIDQSTSDPGETYQASSGALVELAAALTTASQLLYTGQSTFALQHPASSNAAELEGLTPGDVLELPGTSVSAATFGANSLSVTTDAGTYAFTNVVYTSAIPVTSYTAAPDPTTGLVAITFTGPDVFEQNAKATGGPLAGKYLWSNAANWSQGIPVDGAGVAIQDVGGESYDDLPTLTLASLTLNHASVGVTGRSLTVASVAGGALYDPTATYFGFLFADATDAGAPVTVTVGAISGMRSTYGADGIGGLFVDQSTTDPGDTYSVAQNGTVVFAGTPAGNSDFWYDYAFGGPGTIAIAHPAPVTTSDVSYFAPGDRLELPGTTVSGVNFGSNTITATTNVGTYQFAVLQAGYVTGYTAAPDPTTGLVAITFTGPDVFEQNVKATSGPLAGKYLWSNAANWSQGVPTNGSDVDFRDVGGSSYDDLPTLSLNALTLNYATVAVTGQSLTVASVAGGTLTGSTVTYYSQLIADSVDAGASVTVTADAIRGALGTYAVNGADATFVDRSAADPGDTYSVYDGGTILFAGTPSNSSNFWFNFSDDGTIAIAHPAPISGSDFATFDPGDRIELPGTTVSAFTIGNSITATTDAGTYTFSVEQGSSKPITGYTTAPDPTTGLVAITFTHANQFVPNVKVASGPLTGDYAWSNPANWTSGAPADGDSVSLGAGVVSYDDVASLSLTSLTLADNAQVRVTGGMLTVATVAGSADVTMLIADSATGPASVMVRAIVGIGGEYGADGAGATFVDQAIVDPGESYVSQNGGFVELAAAPSDSSILTYTEAGTFALEMAGATNAVSLRGMGAGDALELPGTMVRAVTFATHRLDVTTDAGTFDFTNVDYLGGVPSIYAGTFDGLTGLLALTVACFRSGTRIATERGNIDVEKLAVGDVVPAHFAGSSSIQWIGHRRIDVGRHPRPQDVWPVLVRKGAFGRSRPARDLWLSPDHAVFVECVLIPIRHLVNGVTVVQEPTDTVTYWHVELNRHDVIEAEGLACESFLDTGNRNAFANGGASVQLHPNFGLRVWEAEGCAPLTVAGPKHAWVYDKLLERIDGLTLPPTSYPDVVSSPAARAARN